MNSRRIFRITGAVMMLVAGAATAHGDGHATVPDFVSGLLHPLGGLDHWLIAGALGWWASRAMHASGAFGRASRIALLTIAALYGTAHGAMVGAGLFAPGFAVGLTLGTLWLVLIGYIAERLASVESRRLIQD